MTVCNSNFIINRIHTIMPFCNETCVTEEALLIQVMVIGLYHCCCTGIDEAFLQVAQQMIKLYETSPNSGLHMIDTSNPASSTSPAPPDNAADTFRLSSQATPPNDSSGCPC